MVRSKLKFVKLWDQSRAYFFFSVFRIYSFSFTFFYSFFLQFFSSDFENSTVFSTVFFLLLFSVENFKSKSERFYRKSVEKSMIRNPKTEQKLKLPEVGALIIARSALSSLCAQIRSCPFVRAFVRLIFEWFLPVGRSTTQTCVCLLRLWKVVLGRFQNVTLP